MSASPSSPPPCPPALASHRECRMGQSLGRGQLLRPLTEDDLPGRRSCSSLPACRCHGKSGWAAELEQGVGGKSPSWDSGPLGQSGWEGCTSTHGKEALDHWAVITGSPSGGSRQGESLAHGTHSNAKQANKWVNVPASVRWPARASGEENGATPSYCGPEQGLV